MSAFFELRIYQVLPGKMQEWLSFMEDTIIPYQVKNGMVIHGSFIMDSSDEFSIQNGERIMNSENKGNAGWKIGVAQNRSAALVGWLSSSQVRFS